MSKKILHIGMDGGFLRSFIDFVKDEFEFDKHSFLITTEKYQKSDYKNVVLSQRTVFARLRHYALSVIKMHQSDKVVLHGLFDTKFVFILFLMPWLLRRCCWVLWGGDLYIHHLGEKNWKWKLSEFFRRPVIMNINTITTTVPGDYGLAQKWYGARGSFIQNLMYKSHVCRGTGEEFLPKESKGSIYIQVGNSSDPANNHIEVLSFISENQTGLCEIFCPLSYGSDAHKRYVIKTGKMLFSDRFHPITELMSFDDYNKYLATIDVAIFNHDRQQAMGNIIGLISMGKKVVLKSSITPYEFFTDLELGVYTLADEDIFEPIDVAEAQKNIAIARNYFTLERLKMNWTEVFDEK